ncbi:MAG: phosphoadenosine phosphosulfate reductase family protein, partial [Bacteroidia bacterium]|nr:phosphoadenosine phosphosulfate reductase family protein [Bacteroidia bacterium]
QRPELWNLFNGKKHLGEHFRIFPISNWTELDVWQYLAVEKVPLPNLYFAHKRKVFEREGVLLAATPYIQKRPTEVVEERMVRSRTIGDMTCTGVWESHAVDVDGIIAEVATTRMTERGGRTDDKRSETAMEDRKKGGYF